MAKYKPYDYAQQVLVPVSLEAQLIPGTLEFAIHTLVESRMDMTRFEQRYHNDATGRKAYDPKVLLKVVLCAYARGITSTRKMEQACRENVVFMALSCGQHPDHSTLAAFVPSMEGQIVPLFCDILLVCDEMELLGGTVFALDGCKVPSNASRHWSGTRADFLRKKEKLENKIQGLIAEQQGGETREAEGPEDEDLMGRGNKERQIDKLRKQAVRIEQWLKENDPKIGIKGQEIKSNITDNDSVMMVSSHGTIQGYNGQALVDSKHQIVVYGEAFGRGQDVDHLAPMIEGAKETMVRIGYSPEYFRGKLLTADADYHSATNLTTCDQEGLDAYIPDRMYRRRDPRLSPKRFRLQRENKYCVKDFRYDDVADQYVCPAGKGLRLIAQRCEAGRRLYRRYGADRRDCHACRLHQRCLTQKYGKHRVLSVRIGTTESNLSDEMVAKITTERGRRIYSQRLGIVEPVFANIRTQKRLSRFTLRGKLKVTIQWLLYCMVHNIEKIMNYGFAHAN
jgi:transposase